MTDPNPGHDSQNMWDDEDEAKTSKQEVSDKKFAERLERQANDGHGWDKAPAMMREAADRIMRLIDSTAALDGYWSYECKQNELLRAALIAIRDWSAKPYSNVGDPAKRMQDIAREALRAGHET